MAYDDMSFSKAFAAARKEMGAGKTFTWKGKKYTTDLKEEVKGASSPKPMARPARLDATSGASRGVEGKVKPKMPVAAKASGGAGAGAGGSAKVAAFPKKATPQELSKMSQKDRAARNKAATMARAAMREKK